MRRGLLAAVVAAGTLCATSPAFAERINCVQFVHRASHLSLHGDAWQWWHAAKGQYGRGQSPRPGAVMVFSRTRHLPRGHVAIVRAVRSSRVILVDHANWSPIHGRRGQVELAAAVVDVSPYNDWNQVRVWYHPSSDIGQTVYPVHGFVYPAVPHHHGR